MKAGGLGGGCISEVACWVLPVWELEGRRSGLLWVFVAEGLWVASLGLGERMSELL